MTRLILNGLRHYWRAHLGAFLGAALSAAVLTGALLVGDSVDYSLRTFALARIGEIDYALDTRGQLIEADLAPRVGEALGEPVAPILSIAGMAIHQGATSEDRQQVNRVDVYGVADSFWQVNGDEALSLGPRETAINEKLAAQLGVKIEDEIALRVARPSLMPRDSPLSWSDEDRTVRDTYTVVRVLSDDAMGRFSLKASQTAPYNAFVSLDFLHERIDAGTKANLIVAGGADGEALQRAIDDTWRIGDLGLAVRAHESGIQQLQSDAIFMNDEIARAAMAIPGAQGTLAYLVNHIAKGDKLTPYFFAVAGPAPDGMADVEVVINRWVADEIGADAGDTVELQYAHLTPSNDFENKTASFTVHSIVEMDDLVTEKELMPVFPGLSDVESCADWDVGMPMDDELLNDEANEAYWDEYRETPKIFVTLAAGQRMWASRFGGLTGVRYPGGVEDIENQLRANIDPAAAGLGIIPVREQAMAAVDQAMDFGGLFLGMSFFLIIASIMLTALLYVFSIEQRAHQIGLLLAVGYRKGQVLRLLIGEGAGAACLGAIAGSAIAGLYTQALIYGLSHTWQGAVANTSILYYAKPATYVIGAVSTILCAMIAMWIVTRGLVKRPARELLTMDAGQVDEQVRTGSPGTLSIAIIVACFVGAVGVIFGAQMAGPAAVAPGFFGGGALLLTGGILLFRYLILRQGAHEEDAPFTLRRLSVLNLSRRPGRSVAVAAVLACGCFMVFAVSSMQEDLRAHADDRRAGTGGFALVADSTFPILHEPLEEAMKAGEGVVPIKVRDGDDASCLNLNHAQTPKIFGVNPQAFIARDAFSDAELWNRLDMELPDGHVPALIGDSNTAMWTLKKTGDPVSGDVLIYRDQYGEDVSIKLVGQLPMRLSVFQGAIIIAQDHFTELYPGEDGFRMLLIDAAPGNAESVAAGLNRDFDRFGLNAIPAVERILEYYAVESTYLAMFLVLGAIGLVVGAAGMAVVILRNLFERRSETAMLAAMGYPADTIRQTVWWEYGALTTAALLISAIAAVVAMLPTFMAAESTVDTVAQIRMAALVICACIASLAISVQIGLRRRGFEAIRGE